ncbi:hypothetical protein NDU88_010308 [Pleurodeles waltl]|uniref:Uncharacterized protein n=1 Tax=Pleurodeles waltl TaxID=8319 RepID=A0AAV7PUT0_PLEWA|nr:hypothetical protein NDU88_010308 [Pleurodeles waltl]
METQVFRTVGWRLFLQGNRKNKNTGAHKKVFRTVGWCLFLQGNRKNKNTGAHKKVSGFVGPRFCLVGERAGVGKESGGFMSEQV